MYAVDKRSCLAFDSHCVCGAFPGASQDFVSAFEYALQREEISLRDNGWPKSTGYSKKKAIGARCYARCENNNFYWGWIACTCRKGKQVTFSVSVMKTQSGIAAWSSTHSLTQRKPLYFCSGCIRKWQRSRWHTPERCVYGEGRD